MKEENALTCIQALSNATRLRILRTLVAAGPEGMTAGEIADAVEATPSRASFHLSALAQTGLVRSTKAARSVIYAVDLMTVGGLVQFLLEDCCANHPTVLSCCKLGAPQTPCS